MTIAMTLSGSDSSENEYAALTDNVGFVSLDQWTSISITGEDRLSFLHNMCTNDIRRLEPGTGCEAFCTDVKGKIVAHLFVIVLADQILLLTAPNQASRLIEHLDRYVIREDVKLSDETDEYSWLLISGANSSRFLEKLGHEHSLPLDAPWKNACYSFGELQYLLVRFDQIWPTSYLLRCHRKAKEEIEQELTTFGSVPCSVAVWTTLRLESALPLFGVDFDGDNLPQEVNRNRQAINFNKGCYLGQETIARIDALGHVNKKIVRLRFDTEDVPEPGAKLRVVDKEVGEVTSAVWSPQLDAPLALAMVRRGSNDVGCELESELGKATVVQYEGSPMP